MDSALPAFIQPMLAKLEKAPFDSDDYLFEVKWDGIRALSFVEGGDYRVLSRNKNDLRPRYPELEFLSDLPRGTVLDGELVVLQDGRPSFGAVLSREQAREKRRIEQLTRTLPVSYVVFDVLYLGGQEIMGEGLIDRRERLEALVSEAGHPRFVFSDGIPGAGMAFFEEVERRDLEGMVAKRQDSPYRPGRRSDAWIKVKRVREMQCVILGYLADEHDELRSLIIAGEENGSLVPLGRVGSGFTDAMRARLGSLLRERRVPDPLIDCGMDGLWVEPGLFCTVSYLERTRDGLRAPVFVDLIADTS